jgi:DNA-directed RNA polymerase subunit RPC12/RpoP
MEMIYGASVPVEGATVSAVGASTTTDATGMYSLEVTAGTIDVTASKLLYTDDTETGVLVNLSEHTIDVNFTLTPIINVDVSVMVSGTSTDVDPESDALEMVDIDTTIVMTFEEALNASTIEEFTLDSVTGDTVWNADNMTVTFTPAANLSDSTEYTLTITTAVTNETDMQILPRDVEWVFKTYEEVVPIIPTITPADGATDVALDAEVKITFSHAVNTTATEAAITAAFGTGFTWAADNKSVVISHADFDEGKQYTVSVSDAGESLDGTMKTQAATSTFTTIETKYPIKIGPIKDKDGNILVGAQVVVKDSSGNTVASGTTDSSGYFEDELDDPLPAGTYTVTATKDGKSVSKDFTVAGTESEYDFDMSDAPVPIEKKTDDDEIDWLPIILIIIVIIIIVILLALAMRPKKAAEEELEEEEGEMEEGMEDEEFECPECGAAVTSGEAVCPECGAEFEEEEFECPECGARLEAGAEVCAECGAEFETEEEEMEEGEEMDEEELEDYEVEEDEEFEEEEMEDEEMEDEDMEDEEELPEEDEEELPEDEEEPEEEEALDEEEEEET